MKEMEMAGGVALVTGGAGGIGRAACLEFAITTNQDTGIWGGTSEEERRKLRRAWVARQRQMRAS